MQVQHKHMSMMRGSLPDQILGFFVEKAQCAECPERTREGGQLPARKSSTDRVKNHVVSRHITCHVVNFNWLKSVGLALGKAFLMLSPTVLQRTFLYTTRLTARAHD